jgi:hypothetical protein
MLPVIYLVMDIEMLLVNQVSANMLAKIQPALQGIDVPVRLAVLLYEPLQDDAFDFIQEQPDVKIKNRICPQAQCGR